MVAYIHDAHVGPRIVHEDWQPFSISFVAGSAREMGILHGKMMSYQEGKIDSPFNLRCEIQILVQYISRFYVYYKNINY